mgnify:CR=1 FL=1
MDPEETMSSELPRIILPREERPEPPQFDINALARNAGGHFRLCSLVMKRARELMAGSGRLTDLKAKSPITIALKEFDSDRIELLTPQEVKDRLLGGVPKEKGTGKSSK